MEATSEAAASSARIPATLGRYDLLGTLGQGGMANVYLARLSGSAGFQRLFAIKVLHPHLAAEDAFVEMLLDEARIAARIHHPNVVPIVDLGNESGLHYVVMEYVEGFALSALLRKNPEQRPPRLLIPLMLDALAGLHAAHTLTDDDGNLLNLVHRDVSPQNVLIGTDGIARVIDFGIAKAESRINSTRPGELKGKLSFMSPEQLRTPEQVDFRSDVFSSGVLLWSALTGVQMFAGANSAATLNNILRMEIVPPSTMGLRPPAVLDNVCMKALEREPEQRSSSALEMEEELRAVASEYDMLGSRRDIAAWVKSSFSQELAARRELVRRSIARPNPNGPHSSGTMPIPSWRGQSGESSYSARETTLTPSHLTPARVLSEADCEIVVNEASQSGRSLLLANDFGRARQSRKRWWVVGALALCGGLAAFWATSAKQPSAPAAAVTPPRIALASAPAAVLAAPPPTTTTATAEPTPEPPSRAPVAAAPKARNVRTRVDAAAPKPAARPAEVVSPSPAPKRTTAWDSDSSLPPP